MILSRIDSFLRISIHADGELSFDGLLEGLASPHERFVAQDVE